jgi:hypothetical protein
MLTPKIPGPFCQIPPLQRCFFSKILEFFYLKKNSSFNCKM